MGFYICYLLKYYYVNCEEIIIKIDILILINDTINLFRTQS